MPSESSSQPIFPHRCQFVTTAMPLGGILRYPSPVLDRTGCGELFRQRGDVEFRCWCVLRVPFFIGKAIAVFKDDLAIDADQN
jgi:hypothetical protein